MHHARRLALLAATTAAAAAPAAAAHASSTQTTYFESPNDLLTTQAAREAAFAKLDSLGVRALRVNLAWSNVAPSPKATSKPDFDTTDPANYDWSRYDTTIRAAKERGWKVLLTVTGGVPYWATEDPQRKSPAYRPDPSEFAQFATAIARKYGADVDEWSVWNEPNLDRYLGPLRSKGKLVSPYLYRELYKAFLKGLTSAGYGDAPVLFGEFEPRANSHAIAPLTFLRAALGVDSKYRRLKGSRSSKLRISGIATHPYTTAAGPYFRPPGPNDVTIGVINRMVTAADRLAKAGVVDKGLPIFLTEFGVESKPDPIKGVSLQRQAEYQAVSEKLAYDNRRVAGFSQYLLRDDAKTPGVPEIAAYGGFQSGLEDADGTEKPSFDGFRLPLVVSTASGTKATLWGHVRPAAGATTAQLQQRSGSSGAWTTVGTATTDPLGYFTASVAYAKGRQYRMQWAAPDGTVYDGAPTRFVTRRASS